jgi:hypothetical protein
MRNIFLLERKAPSTQYSEAEAEAVATRKKEKEEKTALVRGQAHLIVPIGLLGRVLAQNLHYTPPALDPDSGTLHRGSADPPTRFRARPLSCLTCSLKRAMTSVPDLPIVSYSNLCENKSGRKRNENENDIEFMATRRWVGWYLL